MDIILDNHTIEANILQNVYEYKYKNNKKAIKKKLDKNPAKKVQPSEYRDKNKTKHSLAYLVNQAIPSKYKNDNYKYDYHPSYKW